MARYWLPVIKESTVFKAWIVVLILAIIWAILRFTPAHFFDPVFWLMSKVGPHA